MDLERLGTAGLKGWRAKIGNAVAPPVSRRSPLDEHQVRAAIGGLFLALSLVYVTGSLRRILHAR